MADRRRDPTTPESRKTYTRDQFLDFYGREHGAKMWKKAGKGAQSAAPAGRPGAMQLNVFLVGPGLIGGALLKQIAQAKPALAKRQLVVRVAGVARSSQYLIDRKGVKLGEDASGVADALGKGKAGKVDEFVRKAAALGLPNSILCDCSASDALTPCYKQALSAGMHVVTANKKANSADLATFRKLAALSAKPGGPRFRYEANVGAGLPVISTLQGMMDTGDEPIEIQGILSGTLAYIFNTISADKPFSGVVKAAKEMGYTEPDPRDDLSGSDVARKIVILARMAGAEVEISDVVIKPIVPESCAGASSVDEFFQKLASDFDAAIEQRRKDADAKGEVLRVIASYNPTRTPKVQMALENVSKSHGAAGISGSENIVVLRTKRYDATPCVVKGPGAGADVTAAGVFQDILSLRDCAVSPK